MLGGASLDMLRVHTLLLRAIKSDLDLVQQCVEFLRILDKSGFGDVFKFCVLFVLSQCHNLVHLNGLPDNYCVCQAVVGTIPAVCWAFDEHLQDMKFL